MSEPKKHVFLVQKDAVMSKDDGSCPAVVPLRHPRTGKGALFMFTPGDAGIQEVLKFEDGQRSWMFGESVHSDGSMLVCTPMDPLFIIIGYMIKMSRTVPLDQLLIDKAFPAASRLMNIPNLTKRLALIADQKGDEDLKAFAYNESKTMSWLLGKVRHVTSALDSKSLICGDGSVSATYVRTQNDVQDPKANLRLACGLVSEYLMEALSSKLSLELGLNEEMPPLKRKAAQATSEPASEPTEKKSKYFEDTPPEKMQKKPPKAAAKAKAMAKAAKGTKSISAFFAPKT